jgi:hypothetical protein
MRRTLRFAVTEGRRMIRPAKQGVHSGELCLNAQKMFQRIAM